MLNFTYHTLRYDFYFLKYFHIFSRTVEATTQATRTSDVGKRIYKGESRGCIAVICHYLTSPNYNALRNI